jgi:hypothetical protein
VAADQVAGGGAVHSIKSGLCSVDEGFLQSCRAFDARFDLPQSTVKSIGFASDASVPFSGGNRAFKTWRP